MMKSVRGSQQCPERADASELPDPKEVVDFFGSRTSHDEIVKSEVLPRPEKYDFFRQSAYVASLDDARERVTVHTATITLSTDGVYYRQFVLPVDEGVAYANAVSSIHPEWKLLALGLSL